MPVWHVSVARVASDRSSIKPENGDSAIHIRRHLTQPEIDILYARIPSAPVFTHGVARPSNGVEFVSVGVRR